MKVGGTNGIDVFCWKTKCTNFAIDGELLGLADVNCNMSPKILKKEKKKTPRNEGNSLVFGEDGGIEIPQVEGNSVIENKLTW